MTKDEFIEKLFYWTCLPPDADLRPPQPEDGSVWSDARAAERLRAVASSVLPTNAPSLAAFVDQLLVAQKAFDDIAPSLESMFAKEAELYSANPQAAPKDIRREFDKAVDRLCVELNREKGSLQPPPRRGDDLVRVYSELMSDAMGLAHEMNYANRDLAWNFNPEQATKAELKLYFFQRLYKTADQILLMHGPEALRYACETVLPRCEDIRKYETQPMLDACLDGVWIEDGIEFSSCNSLFDELTARMRQLAAGVAQAAVQPSEGEHDKTGMVANPPQPESKPQSSPEVVAVPGPNRKTKTAKGAKRCVSEKDKNTIEKYFVGGKNQWRDRLNQLLLRYFERKGAKWGKQELLKYKPYIKTDFPEVGEADRIISAFDKLIHLSVKSFDYVVASTVRALRKTGDLPSKAEQREHKRKSRK